MKKFTGKIGKYRQLSKRSRNLFYIERMKEDKAMNRYYASFEDSEYRERNLVEKLRIKKGGKQRTKQLNYEVWQDEMSSIDFSRI